MMQRIKHLNGLRITALVAALLALLLCFTLGVAADEQTELEVSFDKLNFAGTGITVESDTISKIYDGGNTVATQPTLTAQPAGVKAGDDATVAVEAVTFSSANAGTGTATVTFKITGANADDYVVKPLIVAAKILPKQLTWAANATLNVPYQTTGTAYTGYLAAADLPAWTEVVAGLGSADAQIAVPFTASKAGDYTAQVNVNLNSANYTAPLLTVNITVTKVELIQVDWDGITGLKCGDAVSPVLTGYDAANTAYTVLTYEAPAGYVAGSAGTYTFTAKLVDTDNFTLAAAAVGKTQAITIAPAVYTVSFTSKTVMTDGKTPAMITVMGNDIPVAVLAPVTYAVGGTAFAGSTEIGTYEITATLPADPNFSFVNTLGQEVTTLTATLTVKADHLLVPVTDGNTSVIVSSPAGIGAGVTATAAKAEPQNLPDKAKNYQATTVRINGAAGETFTVFLPIAADLYGKRYDAVSASGVYVYENDKPVQATTKGYTVTVGDGYVKIAGVAGEATFAIAPAYHAPFFTTALGIALIILLIILFFLILFLIGLYVRRTLENSQTTTTVIDTEGEVPAEETKEEEPAAEPEPEEEPEEVPEAEEEADQDALAAAVASALEEAQEEEPEEPAVPAVAAVEEEEEEAVGEDGIVFVEVKTHPEEYQQMLAQEEAGEGQVIYRYKKSFLSRLAQSQGKVQDYYTGIKNALLSYKGIKSRVSSGYDAFNKGRMKVAKINAKVKTLYVYLAIDPASIQDTKYNAVDVSEKKKFAATPVLMKIRGDRKFKYTLELIESLCGGQLECKKLEKEPEDFRVPYQTTEELIESDLIKQYAGLAPIGYTDSFFEEPEEPEEPEEEDQTETEEIPADADTSNETNV